MADYILTYSKTKFYPYNERKVIRVWERKVRAYIIKFMYALIIFIIEKVSM
jgi:hypothetical protein